MSEPPRAKRWKFPIDRRTALIATGLTLAGNAAGWWGYYRYVAEPLPPARVAPLMEQALIAAQQGTPEGTARSLALLGRVTELEPGYTDGWGMLAIVHAIAAATDGAQIDEASRNRSMAALERARAIDPGNNYAGLAWALLQPRRGNWATVERSLHAAMARRRGNAFLLGMLAALLLSVGRCREAAQTGDAAATAGPPTPAVVTTRVQALWAAKRPDAGRAMEQGFARYPRHLSLWLTRVQMLLGAGRAEEVLAMSRNVEGGPPGIAPALFAGIGSVAQAMLTRVPADIDKAIAQVVDMAPAGVEFAENAIQFACLLGRSDTAFRLTGEYFFGPGFRLGGPRRPFVSRDYARLVNRRTQFLFYPPTAPLRGDPRFERLIKTIGIYRYWVEKGIRPDYTL